MMDPRRGDVIDPLPSRFNFVAPHEQRALARKSFEEKPFIGDPPPSRGAGQGVETEIETERFQFHAVLSKAWSLVHQEQ